MNKLPVKSKKAKPKTRYLNYMVYIDDGNRTKIVKRTGKGIWHSLYEFPMVETGESNFVCEPEMMMYSNEIISVRTLENRAAIHKLSHQTLHVSFVEIKLAGSIDDGVAISDLKQYPFPIVLHNFIQSHWN